MPESVELGAGPKGWIDLKFAVGTAVVCVAFVASSVGYGSSRLGSASAVLQYLSGERLILDQHVKGLGDVRAGSQHSLAYRLTNRPVRLLGAKTSCSCAVLGDLPREVAQSESVDIRISIRAAKMPSDINGNLTIFTDDPQYKMLGANFTGRVIDTSADSASDRPQ